MRQRSDSAPLASGLPDSDAADAPIKNPEHDLVLSARGAIGDTVEAAVVLSGGDGPGEAPSVPVADRHGLDRSGAPVARARAESLVSALSGRQVSAGLVDRLPAMIAALRRTDDVAGGGSVLSLARHEFGWVTGPLDRASYGERTGRKLHVALAELGQLVGWGAYDAGQRGLAQRYNGLFELGRVVVTS